MRRMTRRIILAASCIAALFGAGAVLARMDTSDVSDAKVTIFGVTTHLPGAFIPTRLFCTAAWATPSAPAASDDLEVQLSDATGLPLPKRHIIMGANNSPLIKAVHVETPLDLSAVLDFYRAELSGRGWTENDGALVAPDRAVISFTTAEGPALLRLIRQDDRTIADLSLRKPAAVARADIQPSPGRVKLMFGNTTDEEAVVTINGQTIKLAAHAGRKLTDAADAGRKSPDSPQIDLPPGKYKIASKVASCAAGTREFEVAADETWGLLVGTAGVPLPMRLY